jgi:hypothetical protein
MDVVGAAQDAERFGAHWNPVLGQPLVSDCCRLIVRNPWAADEIKRAIEGVLNQQPDKAVGLAEPVPMPQS